MYNICKECQGNFYGQAFSYGNCIVCDADITCSHMPCYKLCLACSILLNKCLQCGCELEEVK